MPEIQLKLFLQEENLVIKKIETQNSFLPQQEIEFGTFPKSSEQAQFLGLMAYRHYSTIPSERPARVRLSDLKVLEAFADSNNNFSRLLTIKLSKYDEFLVVDAKTKGPWAFDSEKISVQILNMESFRDWLKQPKIELPAIEQQNTSLATAQSLLEAGFGLQAQNCIERLKDKSTASARLLQCHVYLQQKNLVAAQAIYKGLKDQDFGTDLSSFALLKARIAWFSNEVVAARRMAEQIQIEYQKYPLIMAHSHLILGLLELNQNPEQSLLHFRQALDWFIAGHWWWGVMACQINLARLFLNAQDYAQAQQWLNLANLTSLPMNELVQAEVLELSRELALVSNQPVPVFETPFFSSGSVRNELNLRLEIIKNANQERAGLEHQELTKILDQVSHVVQQADALLVQQADALLVQQADALLEKP